MATRTTVFTCQQCEYQAPKWLGRCPECGGWGSLVEESAAPRSVAAAPLMTARQGAARFADLPTGDAGSRPTGIGELDRVLGGGLVAGAVVLLGGEPGIGKSTLMLQAAARVAAEGRRVLYISGEESAAQLKLRGERLGVDAEELWVQTEIDIDRIVETARELQPEWVVVDSVQAIRCAELGSVPGSVAQVRETASRLVGYAKANDVAVVLVGHVTKDGALAGPRALEHVVDTVLQFEGDRHHAYRTVRTLKNRFGPAGELAVFAMGERGLAEVPEASEFFLSQRSAGQPGSAVCPAQEGSRPVLVEVQALVGDAAQGSPRRTSIGVDGQRVAMILAVLERRLGFGLAARDVFVNLAGGINVAEPATDVAVAAAIVGSALDRPIAGEQVLVGEIGLTGEIRNVGRLPQRLREASRLGFERALVPAAGLEPEDARDCGLAVRGVDRLDQVLGLLFPEGPGASPRR